MPKSKDTYIKSTSSGRLYIETSDFFKQKKIKETIESLLDSDIIKKIDERNNHNKSKLQEA